MTDGGVSGASVAASSGVCAGPIGRRNPRTREAADLGDDGGGAADATFADL